MIEFTLYCFCKVFELAYSGEPRDHNKLHLYNLFCTEVSPGALSKVVSGETKGNNWVSRISKDSNVYKAIDDNIVRYVYRKIIKKPANDIDKNFLLEQLLIYALTQNKQQQVYHNKDKNEIQEYIQSMKDRKEAEFSTDEKFLSEEFTLSSEHDTENKIKNFVKQDAIQYQETFSTLLQNAYECLITYREAICKANDNTISSATRDIQEIFQKIYLYHEKTQFSDPQKSEKAKEITVNFNEYVESFNQFVGYSFNERMYPDAQQYAMLAENKFNALLQLVIKLLSKHGQKN